MAFDDEYCAVCGDAYEYCSCVILERYDLEQERKALIYDFDKVKPENRARYDEIQKRLAELEDLD